MAGGRNFPCNGVAEGDMGDLLVGSKLHLHRGADRADNPGNVVGLVVDEAHAIVLLRAGRNFERLRGRDRQHSDDRRKEERSYHQFNASGSARYSLTRNPSGFTNRSLEEIGALA